MSDALKVNVRGPAKAVWNVIAYRAGEKEVCWPSLETLCEETGFGMSTVCRALDELETLGLIFRTRSEGKKTTRYLINSPRAAELTVPLRDTKERERKERHDVQLSSAAKRDIERAKMVHRRSEVKSVFMALCHLHPTEVLITAPMVAREMGAPVAKIRTDLSALMKNGDLPDLYAMRWGKTKFNPRHARRLVNVIPFQRAAR
jgi:DNA-binding transcriptional regulator YhcF (GntR family)